jgi:hypothetical protein
VYGKRGYQGLPLIQRAADTIAQINYLCDVWFKCCGFVPGVLFPRLALDDPVPQSGTAMMTVTCSGSTFGRRGRIQVPESSRLL